MNLDWINPLEAILASVRYGPLHRFSFSTDSGWLFYRTEKLLRQYGVPVYGREIVPSTSSGTGNTEQAFRVRRKQAEWAEYILCRAGCPLTCALLDPRHAASTGSATGRSLSLSKGNLPIPWTKEGIGATTLIGHILDAMDRVLP